MILNIRFLVTSVGAGQCNLEHGLSSSTIRTQNIIILCMIPSHGGIAIVYSMLLVILSGLKFQEKLVKSGKDHLVGFDPFNTGLFIDCNCFSCCRVGGGPAEEGPDAMRWFDEIQRACSTAWKRFYFKFTPIQRRTMDGNA